MVNVLSLAGQLCVSAPLSPRLIRKEQPLSLEERCAAATVAKQKSVLFTYMNGDSHEIEVTGQSIAILKHQESERTGVPSFFLRFITPDEKEYADSTIIKQSSSTSITCFISIDLESLDLDSLQKLNDSLDKTKEYLNKPILEKVLTQLTHRLERSKDIVKGSDPIKKEKEQEQGDIQIAIINILGTIAKNNKNKKGEETLSIFEVLLQIAEKDHYHQSSRSAALNCLPMIILHS